MASFNIIPSCEGPLPYLKNSSFSLARKAHYLYSQRPLPTSTSRLSKQVLPYISAAAKFNLAEVMGGRGLCSGEKGLQLELQRSTTTADGNNHDQLENGNSSDATTSSDSDDIQVPLAENAFEKELMGLTGGFPGGEKGLKSFIEKCPPPSSSQLMMINTNTKPKPPQLPLLMPGMIAIVKNPSNPFYMYCGIIQRITDGKAGVLFEGGNWDKLITFRLDELERRDKGPPMVNPKSAVLESLRKKDS